MQRITKGTELFTDENNRLLIDSYNTRFEIDAYAMQNGSVPKVLREAATLLAGLAQEGYGDTWRDVSEVGQDIQAQIAAVRICYTALAEMELFIRRTATDEVKFFNRQIEAVNKATGVEA